MKGMEIMKRKKMLVMATVFAMLFGLAQIAGASILNHFVSTSGNSNIVNFNFNDNGLANGWYFGIYDFGANPSSGLHLLEGSSLTFWDGANFSVTQSGNDWIITVTDGTYQGNSLNIGDSEDFSFYFWNGSTNSPIYDTGFSITGGAFNYGFSSTPPSGDGGNILGADLNPVPLPGSVILLFSGIMGLVAFGSRRKIMK